MDDIEKTASALHKLAEAIKLLRSIRDTNNELLEISTTVKTQASLAEKLDIAGHGEVCQNFKHTVAVVQNRAVSIESFGPTFAAVGEELDNKSRSYTETKEVTAVELNDIVSTLQRALDMAILFAAEYEAFKKELAAAQQAAADLVESVKKELDEKEAEARSTRNWGIATTVGAGALGAALLAAGFFTGGETWSLAAAAFKEAFSAARHVLDPSLLNGLVHELKHQVDELTNVANELRSVSDKAEGLPLSSNMVDALNQVLAMCKRDHQRQLKAETAQRMLVETEGMLVEAQRQKEEEQRQKEDVLRQKEEEQRQKEEEQRQKEEVQRKLAEAQKQTEEVQRKLAEVQRQKKEGKGKWLRRIPSCLTCFSSKAATV